MFTWSDEKAELLVGTPWPQLHRVKLASFAHGGVSCCGGRLPLFTCSHVMHVKAWWARNTSICDNLLYAVRRNLCQQFSCPTPRFSKLLALIVRQAKSCRCCPWGRGPSFYSAGPLQRGRGDTFGPTVLTFCCDWRAS